jgi:hypothetical protein
MKNSGYPEKLWGNFVFDFCGDVTTLRATSLFLFFGRSQFFNMPKVFARRYAALSAFEQAGVAYLSGSLNG